MIEEVSINPNPNPLLPLLPTFGFPKKKTNTTNANKIIIPRVINKL